MGLHRPDFVVDGGICLWAHPALQAPLRGRGGCRRSCSLPSLEGWREATVWAQYVVINSTVS
ncbi:MAG: hypothetical protein K6A67_09555 [Bacteroidales bacterium]|nr:hypothetical protein [Bacteroidales bacterium]